MPCRPFVAKFDLIWFDIYYVGSADVRDWQTAGALRRPPASPGCG